GVIVPPMPFVTDVIMVNTWTILMSTDAVWVLPPPVPVMVIEYAPADVDASAVIVRRELPEPGAAMGLCRKFAVAPVGRPDAESETALLKLPRTEVLTAVIPIEPCGTDTVTGAAAIVKSGIQLFTSAEASTDPRPVAMS